MADRQIRLFGGIFLLVVVALTIVYFLFFHASYEPLIENIRESDAAAIVAELEEEGFSLKLADGGRTILVPENQVNEARLAIAGSGLAAGSVAGFELFDESDMGLTEFAQKINYLRALQGELARTIMTMDDISYARVHIALPERSLFRRSENHPSAAVTVHSMTNTPLSQDQVAGIQRLVAAAIPEMQVEDVAMLDHYGRLISPVPQPETTGRPVAKSRRSALEDYFVAIATSALSGELADERYDIDVSLPAPVASEGGEDAPASVPDPAQASMRVTVWTEEPLASARQADIGETLAEALSIDTSADDELYFSVRPFGSPVASGGAAEMPDSFVGEVGPADAREDHFPTWLMLIFGFCLLPFVAIFLLSRKRSRLSEEDRDRFADLLKQKIDSEGEASHG